MVDSRHIGPIDGCTFVTHPFCGKKYGDDEGSSQHVYCSLHDPDEAKRLALKQPTASHPVEATKKMKKAVPIPRARKRRGSQDKTGLAAKKLEEQQRVVQEQPAPLNIPTPTTSRTETKLSPETPTPVPAGSLPTPPGTQLKEKGSPKEKGLAKEKEQLKQKGSDREKEPAKGLVKLGNQEWGGDEQEEFCEAARRINETNRVEMKEMEQKIATEKF
ncbi:hypothetical protein HK101_001373 [Irineochytrium annulatum]|nr:hypothetical protein HK101_001373 [Irineochytrium annulatum]